MIFRRLLELEEKKKPIKIGAHGAGWMGRGQHVNQRINQSQTIYFL